MNKLAKIIDELGQEDLMKIKRDLLAGNVDRLVEKKLNDLNRLNISDKQCPVCSGAITEGAYILEFGPTYLRRRAYFDAVDCLNYFAEVNLKQKSEEKKI